MWRARFGRGFGPVIRQTTKWNEWILYIATKCIWLDRNKHVMYRWCSSKFNIVMECCINFRVILSSSKCGECSFCSECHEVLWNSGSQCGCNDLPTLRAHAMAYPLQQELLQVPYPTSWWYIPFLSSTFTKATTPAEYLLLSQSMKSGKVNRYEIWGVLFLASGMWYSGWLVEATWKIKVVGSPEI